MSKIVLNNITNPENVSLINENFNKIVDEFDKKVLYRKVPTEEPNYMDNHMTDFYRVLIVQIDSTPRV